MKTEIKCYYSKLLQEISFYTIKWKPKVVLTIRNEAFYDSPSLREFVISFWIDGFYFKLIIERNRQFDGNYGTIANHELHKRASFMKMTQRGGTISIESLRIRQLQALPFIPLFQRAAWYTSLLKFGNGKCNGIFQITDF